MGNQLSILVQNYFFLTCWLPKIILENKLKNTMKILEIDQ